MDDPLGNANKEWCKIDLENSKDKTPVEKDWDYCIDELDYDSLR
jgi:hypothetical protein